MARVDPVVAIVGIKALSRDINKLATDTKSPLFKAMIAAGRTGGRPGRRGHPGRPAHIREDRPGRRTVRGPTGRHGTGVGEPDGRHRTDGV